MQHIITVEKAIQNNVTAGQLHMIASWHECRAEIGPKTEAFRHTLISNHVRAVAFAVSDAA